jgi:hypothetical protein
MKKIICLVCLLLSLATHARAVSSSFWDDLLKAGSKGDDSFRAAGRAEHVADDVARSAARGQLHLGVEVTSDVAARGRQYKRMLLEVLHQPDPDLLRRIEILDPNQLGAALVLARGSGALTKAIPDVASRARLLRDGGSELVAAIGTHGDEVTRDAVRLHGLISAGQLPERVAQQGTIARFSELMRKNSGEAWKFWQEYVSPHWGKWVSGGLLAAYLSNPEAFQDGAGKITEEGTRRITEVLGTVIAEAIIGAGKGGKDVIDRNLPPIMFRYFVGGDCWKAWVGLAAVGWGLGILFPRTRRWCVAPLRWLLTKPNRKTHG